MRTNRHESGFTLLETLVALFFVTVAALGAAPLFIQAAQANESGGDIGVLGAAALDRMERLREQSYGTLEPGGSLTTDVAGYSDTSDPSLQVRWRIAVAASPVGTKVIDVVAEPRRTGTGPQRRVALTSVRGL